MLVRPRFPALLSLRASSCPSTREPRLPPPTEDGLGQTCEQMRGPATEPRKKSKPPSKSNRAQKVKFPRVLRIYKINYRELSRFFHNVRLHGPLLPPWVPAARPGSSVLFIAPTSQDGGRGPHSACHPMIPTIHPTQAEPAPNRAPAAFPPSLRTATLRASSRPSCSGSIARHWCAAGPQLRCAGGQCRVHLAQPGSTAGAPHF